MAICQNCGFRIGKNNRIKVKGTWEHKSCPLEGIEHKKKITNELISKSNAIFNKKSMILTGEVLTRTELRLLERRGRVKKSYRKYGDGVLRCVWMRPSTHEKLKAAEKARKKKEEEEKRKKEELDTKIKKILSTLTGLNLFKRIWRFIKKIFGGKNGRTKNNKKSHES